MRLQAQRLVIVFDRAVVFAGVVEDVGADFIALGIVGLEPDRLVQRSKRFDGLALLAQDFAAGPEGVRGTGLSAMT